MKNKMINPGSLLLWVGLFSIAMGFLECAVVVYLRTIYYPDGFAFPLKIISPQLAITELFREASTVVMLICIGMIAAKKAIVRFALFIYAFAIWDIFYYIFLFLILGWPPSLLTWDLLFLIPLPWVGPVVAPIINSLTMILLAVMIIIYNSRNQKAVLKAAEWSGLIIGSLITICAYTYDYLHYMLAKYPLSEVISFAPGQEILQFSALYMPVHFNWLLFCVAEVLFAGVLVVYYYRLRKYVA
jgi:hypothetical protein